MNNIFSAELIDTANPFPPGMIEEIISLDDVLGKSMSNANDSDEILQLVTSVIDSLDT